MVDKPYFNRLPHLDSGFYLHNQLLSHILLPHVAIIVLIMSQRKVNLCLIKRSHLLGLDKSQHYEIHRGGFFLRTSMELLLGLMMMAYHAIPIFHEFYFIECLGL